VPARVVAGGLGSTHEAYGVATRLVGVDLPEPVPADAPDRLLAGLDELAARGPQLLVVDDVQRVDAATLALLERGRIGERPAARSGAHPGAHPRPRLPQIPAEVF
jgi:hypothetical protein